MEKTEHKSAKPEHDMPPTQDKDRDLREAIRAGEISDKDILANTPPVPHDEKLAAIKRDEAAHGGMSARDRVDHPERVPEPRTR